MSIPIPIATISSITSSYIKGSTDKLIYTMKGYDLKNIIEIIYTPKKSGAPSQNYTMEQNWEGRPKLEQNYTADSDQSHWSYENNNGTSVIFTIPDGIFGQYYIQLNSNGHYSPPYFYEFPSKLSG